MSRTPQERVQDFIIEARMQKGWSQAELSRQTGIYPNQISKYESGINKPTAEYLFKVADATGTKIQFIFPDDQEPEKTD